MENFEPTTPDEKRVHVALNVNGFGLGQSYKTLFDALLDIMKYTHGYGGDDVDIVISRASDKVGQVDYIGLSNRLKEEGIDGIPVFVSKGIGE